MNKNKTVVQEVVEKRVRSAGRRVRDEARVVANLDDDNNTEVPCPICLNGRPVCAPASFGSGSDEHRMAYLQFNSQEGGIVAFSH